MEEFLRKNLFLAIPYSISVGLSFYIGLFILSDLLILSFLNVQDITNAALIASAFIVPQLVVIYLSTKSQDVIESTKKNIYKKFPRLVQPHWFFEKIIAVIIFSVFCYYCVKYLGSSEYFPFVIMGLSVGGINLLIGDTKFIRRFHLSYFAGVGMLIAFTLGVSLFYSSLNQKTTHRICNTECVEVHILIATSENIIALVENKITIFNKSDVSIVELGEPVFDFLNRLWNSHEQ